MITFVSLLAYKGLDVHVRKIVTKKVHRSVKYYGIPVRNRMINEHTVGLIEFKKLNKGRKYRRHVVNKWRVILFLAKNPILIMYRKRNN